MKPLPKAFKGRARLLLTSTENTRSSMPGSPLCQTGFDWLSLLWLTIADSDLTERDPRTWIRL